MRRLATIYEFYKFNDTGARMLVYIYHRTKGVAAQQKQQQTPQTTLTVERNCRTKI